MLHIFWSLGVGSSLFIACYNICPNETFKIIDKISFTHE